MTAVRIEFPLTIRPVVRNRAGGAPTGVRVPYHGAVWLVDRGGNHVLDVGPHVDDLLAGRVSDDPHKLVARAARVVAWFHALEKRVRAWIEPLETADELIVRPFVAVKGAGPLVEVGVQFCSGADEEFDRVTGEVRVLDDEGDLVRVLDSLRSRVARNHESALSILLGLQEAVQSWRIADEVAPNADPLLIDDTSVESA